MKMRWMTSVALMAGMVTATGCKTSERPDEFEPVKKKPSAMTPGPVTPPAPVAFEKVKKGNVSVTTPPAPAEFEKVSKPPAPAEFEKVSKPAAPSTPPPPAEFEKVTKPVATAPAPAEFEAIKKKDPQK